MLRVNSNNISGTHKGTSMKTRHDTIHRMHSYSMETAIFTI
jgi:hypothetical protein